MLVARIIFYSNPIVRVLLTVVVLLDNGDWMVFELAIILLPCNAAVVNSILLVTRNRRYECWNIPCVFAGPVVFIETYIFSSFCKTRPIMWPYFILISIYRVDNALSQCYFGSRKSFWTWHTSVFQLWSWFRENIFIFQSNIQF